MMLYSQRRFLDPGAHQPAFEKFDIRTKELSIVSAGTERTM